jgi:hypothetical protein
LRALSDYHIYPDSIPNSFFLVLNLRCLLATRTNKFYTALRMCSVGQKDRRYLAHINSGSPTALLTERKIHSTSSTHIPRISLHGTPPNLLKYPTVYLTLIYCPVFLTTAHRTDQESTKEEGRPTRSTRTTKKRRCGEDKQKHDEKWQDNGVCVNVCGRGQGSCEERESR